MNLVEMTDLIASCRLAEVIDHSSDLIFFSLIVPYFLFPEGEDRGGYCPWASGEVTQMTASGTHKQETTRGIPFLFIVFPMKGFSWYNLCVRSTTRITLDRSSMERFSPLLTAVYLHTGNTVCYYKSMPTTASVKREVLNKLFTSLMELTL